MTATPRLVPNTREPIEDASAWRHISLAQNHDLPSQDCATVRPSRTSHDPGWNWARCSIQQAANDVGGLAVAGFEEVGVNVQGRRRVDVAESPADGADGDAGGEQLGGVEVSQVMKPGRLRGLPALAPG